MTFGGRRGLVAMLLVGASLLSSACLDPVEEPHPVVALRAPVDGVEVESGASVVVAVQALDTASVGVNGAEVTFARSSAEVLVFDEDDAADSVTVTTSTEEVDELEVVGVAAVRVRVPSGVDPQETSVIAVVKEPTPKGEDPASVRIQIRIVQPKPTDAGTDSSFDAAGNAVSDAKSDATTDASAEAAANDGGPNDGGLTEGGG